MSVGLLRKFSILYLLLPNLLFAIGWFRLQYSMVLVFGFLYLLYIECKKNDISASLSLKDIVTVLFAAILITFFCGVDGYSTQSFDWLAHNIKFYDLFKNAWPTYFKEVDRYACYYFGYYLVPAFLSKIAENLLPDVLVIWTLLGFFLGMMWLYLLLEKNKFLLFLFFFLRGTGQLVNDILRKLDFLHIRRAPVFNPSLRSIFENSTFVPNQLIPALICCGIMLHDFNEKKRSDTVFFVVILTFIWGVFPAMSLMVIFFLIVIKNYLFDNGIKQLTVYNFTHEYLLPGLLFIPTFIYFLSSQRAIVKGFLLSFEPRGTVILSYLTGTVLDLTMLSVLAFGLKKSKAFPLWFINSLIIALAALSLYRMGKFNDSYFRGSTPFCVLIFIVILRGVFAVYKTNEWPDWKPFYFAGGLMIMLVITQITIRIPILRDNLIANHLFGARKSFHVISYDSYPNTYQVLVNGYHDEAGAKQYLAAKNSWYEKYLSR